MQSGNTTFHSLVRLLPAAWILVLSACGFAPAASSPEPAFATQVLALRDADVPELPFPDNPDPSLCGIPVQWGSDEPAWLSGYFQGELIEPIVHLYDSHLRLHITAEAPTGTEVRVLLYQENPVTDYYLVRTLAGMEGWVPEHFVVFEPPEG